MASRNTQTSRPFSLLSLTLAMTVIAGCGTHAPPKINEEQVKQLASKGYVSDVHFSITTSHLSWMTGETSFNCTLTAPTTASGVPLIIYLPGLGESRDAGELWRTAWAQAGYGVLVVQLLADDSNAWSSTVARQGNFELLVRQRYSVEVATARQNALATIMAEIAKRKSSGDVSLDRIDISRLAIAGYDIGAYTSMLAAGELPKSGSVKVNLPLPISATIALSPYADFSGNTFASRYQAVAGPTLSISGDGDVDAPGAVISPQLRKAPFENMRSKNAYLLWLSNVGHSVLSGAQEAGFERLEKSEARSDGSESDGQQHKGSRRGGKESRSKTGAPLENQVSGKGAAFSPTDRVIAQKLIQGVTTAFLDTYLRNDSIAAEWLQKDAQRWIGQRGNLQHK